MNYQSIDSWDSLLGDKIKQARKQLGLRIDEFAEELDISFYDLYNIEEGCVGYGGGKLLMKILETLEIDVSEEEIARTRIDPMNDFVGLTLGKRLQLLRNRTKKSRSSVTRDLALLAKILEQWENDIYVPSSKQLTNLANYYGVGVSQLLKDYGDFVLPSFDVAHWKSYLTGNSISERLKQVIEWSDGDLALLCVRAGLSFCTVSDWASGKVQYPTKELLKKLLDTAGVSFSFFEEFYPFEIPMETYYDDKEGETIFTTDDKDEWNREQEEFKEQLKKAMMGQIPVGKSLIAFPEDSPEVRLNELKKRCEPIYDSISLLINTLIAKSADYGTSEDALANLRASELLGVPAWVAAIIRGGDKWQRIKSFLQKGYLVVEDEKISDSILDMAGYLLLSYTLYVTREQTNERDNSGNL